MSIEETIEMIREQNQRKVGPRRLTAFADAYEALQAENAELRHQINECIQAMSPKVYGDTARGHGIGGQVVSGESFEEYTARMYDNAKKLTAVLDKYKGAE